MSCEAEDCLDRTLPPAEQRFAGSAFAAFFTVQWIYEPLQERFQWRHLSPTDRGQGAYKLEHLSETIARFPPRSQTRLLRMIESTLASGEPVRERLMLLNRGGDHTVECFVMRERDADGRPLVMGLLRDISEKVENEQKIAELDRLLHDVADAAGGILVTRGTTMLAVSRQFRKLIGIRDGLAVEMKPLGLLKTVCPPETFSRLSQLCDGAGRDTGEFEAVFAAKAQKKVRYTVEPWRSAATGAGGRIVVLDEIAA